ncbi:quinone oxidoreductase family protein [Bifidobacterium sp.]|uniref:Enoyl reductase (ER) domain-containing protein n=2 Tax=Bifidobacterium tibiigranuli TaxID=2172043 RepID=A0A5N6SAH4_9BIFI|nr:hypothetical protein DDE84_01385 [Bifidobacterium tibiigranuli]KAE8130383.1 hypothetical protein DDF78_00265 [Bifidobacterium tibiigranuli]
MTQAMRVERFGEPSAGVHTHSQTVRPTHGRALVRITHASVGSTDIAAIRGDYLLQPFPGFTPGYDFVGVIESLGSSQHSNLQVGQRVAGVLPRMGTHATHIAVAPSLVVPVPDELDSAVAAATPLDAVTARFAISALGFEGGSLLIQGAGGAVGSWAVQFATALGYCVFGTASQRTRGLAERLGATVFDYHDPDWMDRLVAATHGGVTGAIDHTGSRSLRHAVAPHGRIVRIAFDDTSRYQRLSTATGFLTAGLRRCSRPSERVCSVPLIVMARRAAYRSALASIFKGLAIGSLAAPRAVEYPFDDYADALEHASHVDPGTKTILVMP